MKISKRQLRQTIREAQWGNFTGGAAPLDEPPLDSGMMNPEQQQKVFDILVSTGSDPKKLLASGEFPDVVTEEASTIKYNADPALKGDQTKLPDKLQKGIIDKEDEDEEKKNETFRIRITKRQLRRIIREEMNPGAQGTPDEILGDASSESGSGSGFSPEKKAAIGFINNAMGTSPSADQLDGMGPQIQDYARQKGVSAGALKNQLSKILPSTTQRPHFQVDAGSGAVSSTDGRKVYGERMKITKSQIRRIIRKTVLRESWAGRQDPITGRGGPASVQEWVTWGETFDLSPEYDNDGQLIFYLSHDQRDRAAIAAEALKAGANVDTDYEGNDIIYTDMTDTGPM